jgi:hypothetical protein
VTGYFRGVFARVGVGGTEYAEQYLVDGVLMLCSIIFDDMSIVNGVGLSTREVFGKNTRKNLGRLGT